MENERKANGRKKGMSDFITKKCDNCPKMKLDSNGWWFIVRWLDTAKDTVFSIGHLDREEDWKKYRKANKGKHEIYHVCGHKCLIEKMSKLLGDKNVGGDKTGFIADKQQQESRELIKRIEEAGNTKEVSSIEKTEPNDI
jgi:hypothetical protein